MKIFDLKTTATPFWPAVFIDRVFKMNVGRWLAIVVHFSAFLLSVPVLIIFILGKLAIVEGQAGVIAATLVNNLAPVTPFIYGLFFIALPLELIFQAAAAFYRSYAYLDLESISTEKNTSQMGCSFEAASLILQSPEMDPVRAIAMTHVGQTAFYRLGIGLKETAAFLNDRKGLISLGDIDVDDKSGTVTFHKLAKAVVAADKEFNIFLSSRKVTTDDFVGAIGWAEHIFNLVRRHKRWWSKDALGRIPGIGKDWSYGETPTLWKYAMHIGETPYYLDAPNVLTVRKKEVEELEKVLERISGANAIIVGDTDEEAMGIIAGLGLMIGDGRAMPNLEHKVIYVLNHEAMISAAKDKATFDVKLGNAFAEAIKAGNIILVIKDFPAFIAAAAELGSDVMSFLDMYLASPSIHLIATASTGSFHAAIEGKQAIMRHFEKLLLKSVGGNAVVDYLKNEALTIEGRTGVTFLYQALNEAAVSAERYFFGSDLEDKAADLLIEAATNAKSLNTKVVTREDIMKLVEVKTGIPREATSGSADTKTLLNLEKILSERIVGQQEGVKAIASAMRRARAGITNPKRPMGSFLFLGPTGVGKTETTKALADSFFGGESAIIRLDMSEYRTMDALERLIGNFDLGKPGVLTSALRDKPYGVLLLDEFEKTSKDVLDLFLQVLDEGMFSDMAGRKVSARNLIIIATSNAGSDVIWQMVKQGGSAALNKDVIIDGIIKQGIFKPELLNRFDGVIVFHPLGRSELTRIAELMIKKFSKSLADKGLEIAITPELINALVEKGTDPTFGARPMNRAIQDKVETMIADKILGGEAQPGTKIVFTPEEIETIRK